MGGSKRTVARNRPDGIRISPIRYALKVILLSPPEFSARASCSQVLERMAESRIFVFPSLSYENCPMVVLEALSVATPVISPNHPSMAGIVRHQREGLVFQAGNAQSLAAALREALHADDHTWSRWSNAARQTHTERYSETVNYQQLISIYRNVMHSKLAGEAQPVVLA